MGQLADLRVYLNRSENHGIDSSLFRDIDNALEQSKRTLSNATRAETHKIEMVRDARQLIANAPEGVLPDKQKAMEVITQLPAEAGRQGLLKV